MTFWLTNKDWHKLSLTSDIHGESLCQSLFVNHHTPDAAHALVRVCPTLQHICAILYFRLLKRTLLRSATTSVPRQHQRLQVRSTFVTTGSWNTLFHNFNPFSLPLKHTFPHFQSIFLAMFTLDAFLDDPRRISWIATIFCNASLTPSLSFCRDQ